MKNVKVISVATKLMGILFVILVCIACQKKVNCDSSDNLKLGTVDFTEDFKTWETELNTEVMKFSSIQGTIELKRGTNNNSDPLWLTEYEVCESIDIKPYHAYAYYEYENQSSFFQDDAMTMLVNVEPTIANDNGTRTESIYLTFSHSANGLKGRVPVTNGESMTSEEPFGVLFEFHETIKVGDQEYSNIWFLNKDNTSIYYNQSTGIVALGIGETFYYREG